MTATYDGILSVSKVGVSACCRTMDVCVLRRQIYTSTKGELMLRSSDDPRKGMRIICCPFCSAQLREAVQ